MAESEPDMVRRHVATGRRLVSDQRALLKHLGESDQPTDVAESFLALLVETQKLHVAHLDRLLAVHGLEATVRETLKPR